MHQVLQPEGWAKPRGYANGIAAEGKLIFIAGQIGWDADCQFHSDAFVDQARQALQNIVEVLAAADAKPEHIVRMNWYMTDKQEYLASGRELGQAYREIIGKHYPAMTAVEVTALMEDRAKIEIEVMAVVPT